MALPDEVDKQNNDDDNKNETLEIIREEQTVSPTQSVILHDPEIPKSQPQTLTPSPDVSHQNDNDNENIVLQETENQPESEPVKKQITEADVEKLLKQKEDQLRQDFEKRMIKEVTTLIDRFDFILRNEQIRASYMLTEAHRERQEKVRALQTQLECKNIAGLMYVLCSERKKCRVEKLKIIEDYSNYINSLHQILEDSQQVILNLSRGYKTAARVDHEWRGKMKSIVEEFQNFIYHFAGGTPEENQYFFDLPKLLATRNSIVDNPNEDPIEKSLLSDEEAVGEEIEEEQEEKQWYERFDEECHPFIMYGDMADFKPDRRREVLKTVKAAKTAPRRWKEYVFNDMYLNSKCTRADENKEDILSFYPASKWECPMIRDDTIELAAYSIVPPSDVDSVRRSHGSSLKVKPESRRLTSVDVRGGMGSMLRIITSASATQKSHTKAVLLGARDSLEIASTTALREKHDKKSVDGKEKEKDSINIGMRRTSFFEESKFYDFDKEEFDNAAGLEKVGQMRAQAKVTNNESVTSHLHEMEHVDSLQVIPKHEPDFDHKINEEKVCPIEQCQKRKVNAFMRTLPTYMRLSPFIHFQSTYEQYETCSPEQLEMLKKRIEDKKRREKESRLDPTLVNPLDEWNPSVDGVAIQTSALDLDMAECTCMNPNVTPASSTGRVFDVEELIPIKQKLNAVAKECFYDDQIDFDRFKVIGDEEKTNPVQKEENLKTFHQNFTRNRVQEIREILKKHPSLCEIFQANTKC